MNNKIQKSYFNIHKYKIIHYYIYIGIRRLYNYIRHLKEKNTSKTPKQRGVIILKNTSFFGTGRISTILSYITFLFASNLCFLLTTFPLTLYLLLSKNIDLKFVLLIWIICGPAITALFISNWKLLSGINTGIFKTFFSSYLENFKQSVLFSSMQGLLLFVCYMDMRFFLEKKTFVLYYIFLFLFVFIFAIGFYIYPILSRFKISSINLIKLSFLYSIKKAPILLAALLLFIIVAYASVKDSALYILFSVSVTCFLILKLEKNILTEIEVTFLDEK